MKEFVALVLVMVLIFIGWNQPFKTHFSSVVGDLPPAAAVISPPLADASPASLPQGVPTPVAPQATPARDATWLWKKTTMDSPHAATESKGEAKRGR